MNKKKVEIILYFRYNDKDAKGAFITELIRKVW
jgi:hypothetical protein